MKVAIFGNCNLHSSSDTYDFEEFLQRLTDNGAEIKQVERLGEYDHGGFSAAVLYDEENADKETKYTRKPDFDDVVIQKDGRAYYITNGERGKYAVTPLGIPYATTRTYSSLSEMMHGEDWGGTFQIEKIISLSDWVKEQKND